MTPLNTELEKRYMDIIEAAWGVIANAGTSPGAWESMPKEWQEVAVRWRDEMWHPILREYTDGCKISRYEAALHEIASCDRSNRVHMGPEIAREALGLGERVEPPLCPQPIHDLDPSAKSTSRAPDTGAQLRALSALYDK